MGILSKKQRFVALGLVTLATLSVTYFTPMLSTNTGLIGSNQSNDIEFYKSQQLHQYQRHQRLRSICNHLSKTKRKLNTKTLDHIIVDDQHKLLYCYVPKVACTNWKRVMMVLSKNLGKQPLDIPANASHTAHVLRTLNTYSPSEINLRLKTYLKFIFVRHPFERLVSAFRNKFEKNYSTYFQDRFGRLIIQHYRTNPSESSLILGNDVTFSEFVEYLLDPATVKGGPLNEHWRPVHELCLPCQIHYDIIGKYEHLEKDADYVLRVANVDHVVTFPKLKKGSDTSHVMKHYIRNITREKLSSVYKMYALDFELFGYKLQNVSLD